MPPPIGDIEITADPVSDMKCMKKTFDVCNDEGGGDVKDRVDTADDKCVMGGGKCVTHNVKLKRTVKQKKYSCVNLKGQIEWKFRDVTCLVCPSQAKMIRAKAKTSIPAARGKQAEVS